MTRFGVRIAGGAIILGMLAGSIPAHAASDDTTTGVVAGLGLTAASGKTTISSGGAIEAELLATDALLKAGGLIRQVSLDAAVKRAGLTSPTILVLGHSDTVDFTMARWIEMRLEDIDRARPPEGDCANPMIKEQASGVGKAFLSKLVPAPNDITAAIATDVTIQGVSFSVDDRVLVDAVMLGGNGLNATWQPFSTLPTIAPRQAAHVGVFKVPGEAVDFSPAGDLIEKFRQHQKLEDRSRRCTSATFKAWLSTAAAFDTSVTSASDKGPAPLAAAAELLDLGTDRLVLRVAIENTGGTAITRSNIFYALGIPGAATISAGIIVSFRLTNPVAGQDIVTGFVRCAVRPTRFQDVKQIVSATPSQRADLVVCSYIVN